jgi:hypothetical protein
VALPQQPPIAGPDNLPDHQQRQPADQFVTMMFRTGFDGDIEAWEKI